MQGTNASVSDYVEKDEVCNSFMSTIFVQYLAIFVCFVLFEHFQWGFLISISS